jgi:3-oxoacyl-[acyl-carrier protein] reductase
MNEITLNCQGKVALVTGASGKLGKVIALHLAKAGAKVVLHGFSRPEALKELSSELSNKGYPSCIVTGAIDDPTAIAEMKAVIEKELGTVDILVLNAVSQIFPWKPVLEEEAERLLDQFNSCSLQALHFTQAFVPGMIKKGWGRVIGINTECSMQLTPNQGAYASAKRAMDGLLRVLAGEVGKHEVTVNQVAPGWIDCEEKPDMSKGSKGYIAANSKMGRRARPEDVANCVTFLSTELARSITGAWIPVSCGSVSPRI